MAGSSNEVKLSLKLIVDKKAKKVVFAEAEKEFVDFIFSLMSLPLSCVSKVLLLNEKGMVGSLGALYKSIESLDTQCFESEKYKVNALRGLTDSAIVCVPLLSIYEPPSICLRSTYKPKYVRGGSVYMVTDNLEVSPFSMALIKSHVRDFSELEDKHVEIGLQEGLAILKASLQTNTVLTIQ
ncbi:uncharacterized protein LOC141630969 [Silene latifolia]|uniref:uncharacterized protein LOC141630969 n=1 Tax=Silene latifolia TaxID=37657 RepID=UPI003D76A4E0